MMVQKLASKKRRPKKSPKLKSRTKRTSDKAERAFIKSLREHDQLHEGTGPLPPGATHVLRKKRTKDRVKTRIERKRFSYL